MADDLQVNQYMVVGDCQGCSLPAVVREHYQNVKPFGDNEMKWADCTIGLGYYLSVLATEYRLLINRGELSSLERCKTELYYAIKALNRLDYAYDRWFPNWEVGALPLSKEPDGFFIRDDVSQEFYDNHQGELNDLNEMFHHKQIGMFSSAFSGATPYGGDPQNQQSIDQILSVIMGLVNIVHFVDDQITVKSVDGQALAPDEFFKFRTWARNYITILVEKTSQNNWRLKDPSGFTIPPKRGGNASAFAVPLTTINNKWGARKLYPSITDNQVGLWYLLATKPFQWLNSLKDKTDNLHMALTTLALSNNWVNLALVPKNKARDRIRAISKYGYQWADFYLTMFHLYHYSEAWKDADKDRVMDEFKDAFNFLPSTGPETNEKFSEPHSPGEDSRFGWRSARRFQRPPIFQLNGEKDEHLDYRKYGKWDGLDYMLLHNLYLLAFGANSPFTSFVHRVVTKEHTNSTALNLGAFYDITVYGKQFGNQTFIEAPKKITLKPSFQSGKKAHIGLRNTNVGYYFNELRVDTGFIPPKNEIFLLEYEEDSLMNAPNFSQWNFEPLTSSDTLEEPDLSIDTSIVTDETIDFLVYPVPTSSILTIDVSNSPLLANTFLEVLIYRNNDQIIVNSFNMDESELQSTVDVSNFDDGSYTILIRNIDYAASKTFTVLH